MFTKGKSVGCPVRRAQFTSKATTAKRPPLQDKKRFMPMVHSLAKRNQHYVALETAQKAGLLKIGLVELRSVMITTIHSTEKEVFPWLKEWILLAQQKPHDSFYSIIMKELARLKRDQDAWNWFLYLKDNNLGLKSGQLYTSLFKVLAQGGHHHKIQEAFAVAVSQKVTLVPPLFNVLIWNVSSLELADSWLQKMKECNVEPSIHTLTAFVFRCHTMEEFVARLQGMTHLTPTCQIFNALLSCKQFKLTLGGIKLMLKVMEDHHQRPDESIYIHILKYCAKNSLKEELWIFFDQMLTQNGLVIGEVPYNIVFHHCSDSHKVRCLDIMQKRNVPFTTFMFNTVLNIFAKQNSDMALNYFERQLNKGIIPNQISFAIVIGLASKIPGFSLEYWIDRILQIQSNTKTSTCYKEPLLCVHVFNSVLKGYGESNKRIEDMHYVLSTMKSFNVCPDAFTMSILINNLKRLKNIERVEQEIGSLINCGAKPNIQTINTALGVYLTPQDIVHLHLQKWLDLAKLHNIIPDYTTVLATVKALNFQGRLSQTIFWLDVLHNIGLPKQKQMYTDLCFMLARKPYNHRILVAELAKQLAIVSD